MRRSRHNTWVARLSSVERAAVGIDAELTHRASSVLSRLQREADAYAALTLHRLRPE